MILLGSVAENKIFFRIRRIFKAIFSNPDLQGGNTDRAN
jgi:hypothetical protein